MIDFERLESQKEQLREEFLNAKPFPHIAIDKFLYEDEAMKLYENMPNPDPDNKIKDPFFSKNRYQYPDYRNFSPEFKKLHEDLTSDRFAKVLSYITNEDVFIDSGFHGGGLHLGTNEAHLDMHADFNYHPKHKNWFRNLNLLLYLNKDWKEEYGGHLKLEDARTGEKVKVGVPMNRMVIMLCRDYTLHGYDTLNFPEGEYRRSIASYAYTIHEKPLEKPRTTVWVAKDNPFKKALAKIWIPAVAIKKKIFG